MLSKVSLPTDLVEVNIASYGDIARMINPWLSDFSADYMDQPTELIFFPQYVWDRFRSTEIYLYLSGSKCETVLGIYHLNLG